MDRVCMFVIDPQNDFCSPDGALYVPNAEQDMARLSKFMLDNVMMFANMYITFDAHSNFHIAHQEFWKYEDGSMPDEYTIITKDDVESGKITSTRIRDRDWSIRYVNSLHNYGKYELCIWPKHCIIGTAGYQLNGDILKAIEEYELTKLENVNYITKSISAFTEHYSVFRAEVPDDRDQSTFFNRKTFNDIMMNDKVIIAGEALSHCVASTIYDIARYNNDDLSKVILLTDCSSNVKGFDHLGEAVIEYGQSKGMKVATTQDVMNLLDV